MSTPQGQTTTGSLGTVVTATPGYYFLGGWNGGGVPSYNNRLTMSDQPYTFYDPNYDKRGSAGDQDFRIDIRDGGRGDGEKTKTPGDTAPTTTTTKSSIPRAPRGVYIPNEQPEAVYVAFARHERATICDGPLTCLIEFRLRFISPLYEHCQLVLAWSPETDSPRLISFSTSKRIQSRYIDPEYHRETWMAMTVPSTIGDDPAARRRRSELWEWCKRNECVPFNHRGYYQNGCPLVSYCPCLAYDAGGKAYFCAEQVATALQAAKVVEAEGLTPYLCVPDTVYNALYHRGARPILLKAPESIVYGSNSQTTMRR